MDKKPKSVFESKPDDLKDVRERFQKLQDLWAKDRQRYRDDTYFLYVDHWSDKVRRQRGEDRLTLNVDQLSQYTHQVINDSRQNRPQIKVRPEDSKGDIEVAEIYDGLIRQIQESSNADTCYDIALESAIAGGFGFIRLLHDYKDDDGDEQCIKVAPVPNALTVYMAEHKEPDGADCPECFIVEEIDRAEFKREYPDVDISDWDTEGGNRYGDWCGEKVRVAEHYRVVKKPYEKHKLEDGTWVTAEDYQLAISNGVSVSPIKETRKRNKRVVMWSKICGSGYIEKEVETIWNWIPVAPVWGNLQNVDGEVRHVSMIHNVKDAQLLYDYARSAFAERVGQTPEAPWIAAEGQVENHIEEWDGSTRVRVQRYTPQDLNGVNLPPPQRQDPSDIPAGFAQDAQISQMDIRAGLGMYQAVVGQRGNATSGVQERAQQAKGDMATFHYHDNLARAIRHIGRIIVWAVPKVYDSERVERILGMDGKAELVQLNPNQEQAIQKLGSRVVYNLGVGKYDVSVVVGKGYATRREEAAEAMSLLVQTNPAMWTTHGDLIAEAMDWPDAQKIAARSKLLLPPAIQEAERASEMKEGAPSPEVVAITTQAKAAIEQRDQILQAAHAEMQKLSQEVAALKAGEQTKLNQQQIHAMELQIKEKELLIEAKELEIKNLELLSKQAAVGNAIEAKNIAESSLVSHQEIGGAIQQSVEMMNQSVQQMMTAATMLAQAAAQMSQSASAPRHKSATVTKQPDGTFRLESIETIQ